MIRREFSSEDGRVFFKLVVLLVIVSLCLVLYLVRIPLLRVAGGFLISPDPPSHCDAIVILSDDDFSADRASRAAELYHAGWAPKILASGRWLRPYASIAQLMQRDLESRGVPKNAIVPYSHEAPDTLVELEDIRGFAQAHGWKRLMIVTSNYHTRRTRYLCRHIFADEISYLIEAAPDINYDPDSWWRTRGGLKIFFHESAGLVVAFWEVRHLPKSGHSESILLLAPHLRF